MNELFDKEVNAQKEFEKILSAFTQAPACPRKCVMKMKETDKKKQCTRKNDFGGRKPFIRCTQRTGENNLNKLRISDSGHNEGTICLVKVPGDGFRVWAHEWVPLNSQWLILRIGGTDFLHCWVTDSISLECAESLIIKR